MPNYKKWVEDHPAYKKLITYKVNGEDKYLSLVNLNKEVSYWGGFNYRRDWIAKYGKNPTTGAAFTGSWNEDKTKWTDDVIFPNGTSNPLYISDWEWMFDIFKTAMADLGISDGYCTSIPYQGFNESGDLVSSFGGEGPYFSTLSDGTVDFGGTTNQFRTYMKAMSNWYKKGYLDKKFSERTTDIFYSIDSTSVYSGKVGMFYSYIGQAGNQMETDGQPYTKGICVYGASHPINDVYGEAANKGVKPQTFYQATLADTTSNFIVTSAAKDKDLEALFTFLDYMYSDEGSMLSVGLTKEQYERQKEPVYEELGLTDGAYSWVDKDGNPLENGSISADSVYWKKNPALLKTSYGEASHIGRIPATFVNSYHEYSGDFFDYQNIAVEQYKRYAPNVGIYNNLSSFLSDEENTAYNKCLSSCRYFMSKQCPKFINGSVDISSDTVWNSFVSALNKYKISDVLASINTAASAYNN
jgi:putative aldouronate transport system substrate-binding protein